jgi:protocatechuate 3,4-dioxygenase, beta subunit
MQATRSRDDLARSFPQYDERMQPTHKIAGYKETQIRNPNQPLLKRPTTLSEITGPLDLASKLPVGTNDLSRSKSDGPRALGQLIVVTGRLLDEDARPIRGAVVELWHANSSGRYIHPADEGNPAPIDPNFIGSGRMLTDDAGRFEFLTMKPGAYPVPNHPDLWWRPPHIHLSLFGDGFASRLVTQFYFPGEPLNDIDLILNSVPDAKGRERLISRRVEQREVKVPGALGFTHDVVVRGSRHTPFE